jgi:hypothetical protein
MWKSENTIRSKSKIGLQLWKTWMMMMMMMMIMMMMKSYQPRTNLGKDENDDLLAVSHNTLNRRKNYFCQLLNVQVRGNNDIRQIEMHTSGLLVPEPGC